MTTCDAWVVGPDGAVHYAVGGVGWACRRGSGGAVIGDATPAGRPPLGACPECLRGPREDDGDR